MKTIWIVRFCVTSVVVDLEGKNMSLGIRKFVERRKINQDLGLILFWSVISLRRSKKIYRVTFAGVQLEELQPINFEKVSIAPIFHLWLMVIPKL